MTLRRPALPLAAALVASVAWPAAAGAQDVARTVVAGPSADVDVASNARPDLDVAPDGAAAVAYLAKVGGVDRVHVARRAPGGAFGPGAPVVSGSAQCDLRSTRPAVGVGLGGRTVVVWPAGAVAGNERLCAMISPAAGAPFAAPTGGPVVQGDTPGWTQPEIDLAPNGDGYLAVHDAMFGVYAQRLAGTTFAPVGGAYPAGRLNAEMGGQAEPGDQRGARITTSDDGTTATVAWTETPGGDYKLWARRLAGVAPGDVGAAVEAFVPAVQGRTGVRAFSDMASVAAAAGTTWVAFRQAVDVGGMNYGRLVARTFDGAAFGPAHVIDGLVEPFAESGEYPRIAVDAAGRGLSASYRQNTFATESALLAAGTWSPATPVGPSEAPGRASVALAATGAGLVARFRRTGADDAIVGRVVGGAAEAATPVLSDPAFGPAKPGTDTAGGATDAVVAFVQGSAATTRLVVADVPLPAAVTPPAPGGPGAPSTPGTPSATPAPRISGLRVVPSAFRRGLRSPRVLSVTPRTPHVRFRLDRDARVTLRVERASTGARVGGRCLVRTRARRRAARCVRYVRVAGSATLAARAGLVRVRFEGRLSARRALSPGRYRLVVSARDAAGRVSDPRRAPFTLRAPRRR